MLEIALEIIICLLLATLIGFALGYIVAKSQSAKSKPVTSTKTETKDNSEEELEVVELAVEEEPSQETLVTEETTVSDEVEIPTENAIENALEALEELEDTKAGEIPELLSEPRNGEKDKLTKIKGIGPKVEEKLNDSGIFHFEQIANWTEENMIWLEAHTLFASRVKKEAWVIESKALLS
ncbi:MAG: hypothetical protein DRG09_00220 [Epsilonproteobacteria bacterium]|nr:MAG: hypothetical protein DRG09_00220 [Campylobacterota bacterium]